APVRARHAPQIPSLVEDVSPRRRRQAQEQARQRGLALPLSPTTAVMSGRSASMGSEKFSSARTDALSKRPPPKILVTPRASSSGVIAFHSEQVTRGPGTRLDFSRPGLVALAAIERVGASRMEGAPRREIAEQRQETGDAVKRPFRLERGKTR